jgi:hypothetical protein
MNYVLFNAGGKEYKLVLTTRTMCELEKRLGCNPIDIMVAAADGRLPQVNAMVLILHASCQKFNHGVSIDDCYDIFDNYIADGHALTDFISVIMKIFEVSGLIGQSTESADSQSPNA